MINCLNFRPPPWCVTRETNSSLHRFLSLSQCPVTIREGLGILGLGNTIFFAPASF